MLPVGGINTTCSTPQHTSAETRFYPCAGWHGSPYGQHKHGPSVCCSRECDLLTPGPLVSDQSVVGKQRAGSRQRFGLIARVWVAHNCEACMPKYWSHGRSTTRLQSARGLGMSSPGPDGNNHIPIEDSGIRPRPWSPCLRVQVCLSSLQSHPVQNLISSAPAILAPCTLQFPASPARRLDIWQCPAAA